MKRYYKKSLDAIDAIFDVLNTVDGAVSTRQVYYQLMSKGIVPSTDAGYNKVQRLLVELRRGGEISNDRVCDRTRSKHQRPGWDGLSDILEQCKISYRRNYWSDQYTAVYIGLEKRALEGVFARVVDGYGVGLFPLGGYASLSLLYEWAQEIIELNNIDKDVKIYYFGDFDPTGMNIDENVVRQVSDFGARFTFERVGVLPEDIEKFNLMTLPVKESDSRAKSFIEKYGTRCVELDALPPNELKKRIREVIERNIDADKWERMEVIENEEKETLDKFMQNIAL